MFLLVCDHENIKETQCLKFDIDAPRQISEKRPKIQDSHYAQNLGNKILKIEWMPFFDKI